jgi:glutathione peroxidase
MNSILMAITLFGLWGPKQGNMDPYLETMEKSTEHSIHQFTMNDIDGNPVSLEQYKGKILILVNVASKCGKTPQYADLEAYYQKHKDEDIVILGFPANNFMGQEPGTDAEIKEFCTKNYGVTFPMFSKISVKGKDIHPLYEFLTKKDLNGVMDTSVKWNFQKYLIDKEGRLVTFFDPGTDIHDPEVQKAIEKIR